MLSLRTNSLKRGLSRNNRAISACSIGDLLIIGKARVRVIMTCAFHAHCLHNVIVVPVSTFVAFYGWPFLFGLVTVDIV